MQRVIGAALIVAGSTGIGFWYGERLQEALRQLRYMKRLLEQFNSEIRYGKAALPECCLLVGRKAREPYRAALLAIHEKMSSPEGACFSEKWREYMGKALSELPLKAEEKKIFLEFADCSGFSDNQMQTGATLQCMEVLALAIRNRENNLEKQRRLAGGLGVMGGLLAAVVLF